MKKWFVVGVLLLVIFEIANVWFIMPLPYSQRVRSIDVAYALYSFRWLIRGVGALLLMLGAIAQWRAGGRVARAFVMLGTLVVCGVTYGTNVVMSADHIFVAPERLTMVAAAESRVELNRLVVGVARNGDARAYPVQFIGYHHQVRDSVGGAPVLVTFCTVCRTGRVYSPVVQGREERFRLVGMDHFNAMLEDESTGSWWRQATGEAITGARRGETLSEVPSSQVTLALWLELHPTSLVMQPDSALRSKYSASFDYETGRSRSTLTGTDTASWHDKSWVVGVSHNGVDRAYDWNQLKRARVLNDVLGGTPIVIVLARDTVSFFAFERPDSLTRFSLRGDSLVAGAAAFGLSGRGATASLPPIQASQEFWHSWRQFHPRTSQF